MDIEIPAEEWLHYGNQQWEELGQKLTIKGYDPANFTLLLKNFADGMKFIFLKENKLSADVIPKFVIDMDIPARTRAAMYSDGEKAIVLSWSHLEHQSQRKTTTVHELKSDDDVLLFKGKTPERFYLMGVEEADHARFYTTKNDPGIPDYSSTVKYDATPLELSGLEARLHAAEHAGMSNDIKQIFRMRIDAAIKMRQLIDTNPFSE